MLSKAIYYRIAYSFYEFIRVTKWMNKPSSQPVRKKRY